MHVSMEEHTFVTVNELRVKIKMSYHVISYVYHSFVYHSSVYHSIISYMTILQLVFGCIYAKDKDILKFISR